MRNCFLLFGLLLLLPAFSIAQSGDPYSADWRKADSLFDRGLPQSATKMAEAVYQKAKEKGQQVQMLKAQMYLLKADLQTKEDGYVEAIKRAENEISGTAFPHKAIWYSIAAQLYWNFYQQNRWKFLGRTGVSDDTDIADFEQWDATRFYNKIASLYKASLSQASELKTINIASYDPVLIKGVNTRHLRPTLYDLLAFRALSFFENDEKDITRPAFHFEIDDPASFDEAAIFARHSFNTQDTSALQWHALRIYQQLLSLHMNDANPDALIDADLHRMEFVYRESVLPDKKDLYITALKHIEEKYSSNSLSALAGFRIAQAMMSTDVTTPDMGTRFRSQKKNNNFPAIKQRLERIVDKFPKSEGGILAQQLLASITSKELSVQAEQVVLPNEVSKIAIQYRNTPKAWFRLVPVAIEDYRMAFRRGDDKWKETLLNTKPVKTWSESLPGTADYDMHSTEMKIDALPRGMYAILVSADEDFSPAKNILNYAIFQVSRLSLITQNTGNGFVLDRKDGTPVAGATVELYKEEYRNRSYELIVAQTMQSGKDGSFKLSGQQPQYSAFALKKGDDVLYLSEYLGFYETSEEHIPHERTFFFTDRSIYRPGQTIYFKGIMVRSDQRGKENTVIAGRETEVSFYDANGQKISSQKLTSNEFGSITGSFIAPEGSLTGNMRLGNNNGSADFSVEEYKRPKFSVSYDTIKTSYALNETITLTGRAIAYAGNNIDNATVKYHVTRQVRWPYMWSYYYWPQPAGSQVEITRGIVQTDKDGRFTISFKAIPDKSVNPESLPIFSYTVHADVTDMNGETRSGTQTVNVGYTFIELSADVPEKAQPSQLDTIVISTKNLNGAFVPATVQVRVDRLQSPTGVLRKRLWAVPDQFLMDSLAFKQNFPLDEYRNESDPMLWPSAGRVFEQAVVTTNRPAPVALPVATWRINGWYAIELETTDKNGKKVIEKKLVQVWDKNNRGTISEPLLVVPQHQNAEPGQTVEANVVSAYSTAVIIQQEQRMNGSITTTALNYNDAPLSWSHIIDESDRGGIALSYITVRDNRVYMQQSFVKIPYSNKELSITWETHRDKLLPGAKETWTMVVRGSKKEKIAAEMVAALYDASLDAFRPHQWSMPALFPVLQSRVNWNAPGFGISGNMQLAYMNGREYGHYEKRYDELSLFGYPEYRRMRMMDQSARGEALESVPQSSPAGRVDGYATSAAPPVAKQMGAAGNMALDAAKEESSTTEPTGTQLPGAVPQNISIRKDFRETAFFYPQLKTDAEGNVRIQFDMPEALTEWKLLTLAHTKDMSIGVLDGKVKTQKDLMVMPGLPRFLRQGDDITISTKVSNLSDKLLSGTATLQILDARTLKPLGLPFRLKDATKGFTAAIGQSSAITWDVHVPESLYEPVVLRISSTAGNFTDGEENILPILSNRMLVTETLPLWINGSGEKTFSFDKLKYSDTSKTLSHYNLALEYTGNPAWYAVQALPYLMEYPYECAEQTFNRYYATALAAHIVKQNPRIESIFRSWEELDTAALMSNLEKNQELKSALLEETPWVMEAKNESEQKRRIAQLFETHKLARSLDATMKKLEDMMLPEGGFPWFKGMRPDRYITQYIVTGLARLQHLDVKDGRGDMQRILQKALPYLDGKIMEDHNLLIRNKAKLDEQQISYVQVQYLYLRSFFKSEVSSANKKSFDYYKQQSVKYWPKFNPYMKGMIALALHRYNDQQNPKNILASLRETAITKEEMGMYWIPRGFSYWWYEAPIETQALLIECFTEVDKGTADIDRMKVWLLKQKQTQNWHSTKATADACYALLLSGTDWLMNEPEVTIQLGEKTIRSTELNTQKGTGYFKLNYSGDEIKPSMSNVKLSVQDNSSSTSWGAVYWQYFEQMDKIGFAATPLIVKKQLFIERNTDRGPKLELITAQNVLKVGDKIRARIEIIADRDMEYVHLKDMRAAAFEPVNVISSFKWQGGLGYYEATKDASTNFFFNYLARGKYVFEYPMFVTNEGDFSNGITTIQCMYAPEFSSHSEGTRVRVVN